MKQFIRRFIRQENGAVSVYLIIVTLVIFFFNAVLIDYARIFVAEKQTEQAIRAAVRSTLSSFDTKVQEYGLFVLNGDRDDIFQTIFNENLTVESSSDYFQFVDTRMEMGSHIEPDQERVLVNMDVLRHQILEDMKYRAPIEFSIEIIDKFLFVARAMKETSSFVDVAEAIEDDLEARDKAIDNAIDTLHQSIEKLKEINLRIESEVSISFPNIYTLNNIADQHDQYLEIINEEPYDGDDVIERWLWQERMNQAKQYEHNVHSLINELIVEISMIEQLLNKATDNVIQAQELNKKIQKTIQEHRNKNDDNYANSIEYTSADPNSHEFGDVIDTVNNLSKQLDDYVYDDAYFINLLQHIEKSKQGNNSLKNNMQDFKTNMTFNIYDTYDLAIRSNISIIIRSYKSTLQLINDSVNYAKGEKKIYLEPEEHKDNKNKANEELKKGKNQLEKVNNVIEAVKEDQKIYEALQEIFDHYQGEHEQILDGFSSKKPIKAAKEMMGFMDRLFNDLGNALLGMRNEIYINEYIMTYFNSDTPTGLFNHEDYLFKGREVEYILYGHHTAGMNYSMALGQLFALRFASNLIDAFADPKIRAAGHPLAVLIAAIIYALDQTIKDMEQLGNGEKVPLLRLLKANDILRFGYHDYLRLFLFMNPGKENRLLRLLTVIHHKTGIDFAERPTYITATVETSVRLWFIPQIAQMLGKAGVLEGRVQGNRYYMKKIAAYSY